jgi:hypothetical protein
MEKFSGLVASSTHASGVVACKNVFIGASNSAVFTVFKTKLGLT